MRSEAPALLPIFRSRHQAELLTILFLHPDQEYSASDLARRLTTPMTTLLRDADRLVEAKLITERRVGRNRMLSANIHSRYASALTDLVSLAFGPRVVVEQELQPINGVTAVAIYGSWAARYHDISGAPPHDIDVLVIGQPDRAEVYEASDRIEQRIQLPVNPTICTPKRWHDASDALIQQLQSAPLVWVIGDEPEGD